MSEVRENFRVDSEIHKLFLELMAKRMIKNKTIMFELLITEAAKREKLIK